MSATPLQARSISPSLTVSDLERSLRFYKEGLGFTTGEEWKDGDKLIGVMLESDKVYLMLGQDDFAKGRDRLKGMGVRLYIQVTADINALAEQAKAAGLKLDSGPADLGWGPVGFTLTDPDGYKLTIAAGD
ncbi:MAG TPA: VOC family protein [Gemmatimonadaceae bacterium]|nr:VOC family protein [Gemmatimonadaceae bacterium]